MLHDIGQQIIGNGIKPETSKRYSHRLIQHVIRNKEGAERQKRNTRTVMIKVSGSRHNRAKLNDHRLTWFMLHKIYCMYSDIKNKEERYTAMLLTSMSEHKESKK